MKTQFSDSVRSTSSNLSLTEMLQQPVTELVGVGQDAADALEAIGIKTIFDLGSSSVFAQASAALSAASSDFSLLASDVLDDTAPAVAVTDVPDLPIEHLRVVSAPEAAALSGALDVATVREFALWPPRQLAHTMVGAAVGTDLAEMEEASAEELRPRLGEYPTERVYYDTLVMLGVEPPGNLAQLAGPLSLAELADPGIVFGAPAVGALATYSQSWFAQGVTLGHMLHSLALAPGEATRIAVIDWSRSTRATAAESIEEREQLDNSTLHARAVSEVQNAVADEMQSGGSISTGWAKSTSKASGFAASVGGGIAGTIGGAVGALGFGGGGSSSKQESETESRATSASWSVGSRSVLAEMNQRVNDRTEQHANSVRNRRASAVREVSQTEHEQVSTRIVANYNHMHALTVQYFEVVQIYRVTVQLNKFVRVLFVPFELLDFAGNDADQLLDRFRGQLLPAALTERAFNLLLDDQGKVEIRSGVRVRLPINIGVVADARATVAMARMVATAVPVDGGGGGGDGGGGGGGGGAQPQPDDGDGAGGGAGNLPTSPVIASRFTVVRPGPVVEVIPGDARLVSISFEDVGIERVRVDRPGVPADDATFVVPAATDEVDFPNPILLRQVTGIYVARDDGTNAEGSMVLRYDTEGGQSIAVVPLSLADGTNMQKVAFLAADAVDRRAELLAHLQANRGYYTRAVLERLDSASLVMLLSGVSWNGRPLVDQVEPNPVAVTGNFLVLRAPAEAGDPSGLDANQTWGDLLKDRRIDLSKQDVRLVPIPTSGVFAEAVLGRSNAAEKLDITRFWNWQDSPIPLLPPEIAPVTTGTRATPEDLAPGQLGTPILNVLSPSQLPEPAGLGAVLGAIASGSMFRDMSGLAGTQATAQAASAGTLTAATEAGRIASDNFKAATAQATEMGKAAADMFKVMKSNDGGGSGSKSSAGISGDGARINQGKDLDRRGVSGGGGSTGASAPKVSETRPVFGASSETVQPTVETFSRELAYSDESAAVSPNLVGATTSALGGAPAGPQSLAGFIGSMGSAIGDALTAIGELLVLATIRQDCLDAGIALQTTDLIPMRLHDNHVEFEQVGFAAWTNSSKHVYVNIPWFVDQYTTAINNNSSPDDALKQARAIAVYVIRHEEHHVTQFAGNGDKPPATYAEMVNFEEQAYGQDVTWIQSQPVRTFLLNKIGTKQAVLTTIEDSAQDTHDQFDDWKANQQTESDRRSAMVGANFLPRTIGGSANYPITDLYKTKAP